jgi:hypothetical protein
LNSGSRPQAPGPSAAAGRRVQASKPGPRPQAAAGRRVQASGAVERDQGRTQCAGAIEAATGVTKRGGALRRVARSGVKTDGLASRLETGAWRLAPTPPGACCLWPALRPGAWGLVPGAW